MRQDTARSPNYVAVTATVVSLAAVRGDAGSRRARLGQELPQLPRQPADRPIVRLWRRHAGRSDRRKRHRRTGPRHLAGLPGSARRQSDSPGAGQRLPAGRRLRGAAHAPAVPRRDKGRARWSTPGDCAWPEWGEHANYYSNPVVSYDWGTGPDTFDFTITAENTSAGDYYDVVFAVVGKAAADGTLFYAEEHFYVQVLNTVGDLNCDGAINNFDVDAFVMAMTEPLDYAATYPYCDRMLADIDQSGAINSFDIDPFVALLTAKKAAPGDLNCDGLINAFDLNPFVLALTDPAAYAAAYPDCDRKLADVDLNGTIDTFDIDPFVALISGQ